MTTMDWLYSGKNNPGIYNANKAIIVLPEIFGLNDNIKNIVERFSNELKLPAFGLDFYFPVDGKLHDLDYISDIQKAIDLKSKTTAEDFIQILKTSLDQIQKDNTEITEFSVCGFCFGGRLSLLAGIDTRVTNIFSFYGAGSNQIYYQNQSVVDVLATTRKGGNSLQVRTFFGNLDDSIPQQDRDLTKQILADSGLNYQESVYDAGHAFFRIEGQNYDQKASSSSWVIVKKAIELN